MRNREALCRDRARPSPGRRQRCVVHRDDSRLGLAGGRLAVQRVEQRRFAAAVCLLGRRRPPAIYGRGRRTGSSPPPRACVPPRLWPSGSAVRWCRKNVCAFGKRSSRRVRCVGERGLASPTTARTPGRSCTLKCHARYAKRPRRRASRLAVVRSSRLMMIGFDCRTRSEEYYFRQPQMEASELAVFRRFCDAAPHCQAVLEAFSELSGFPVRAALHWMNFGYSISPGSEGFVLFVRSRSLRDVAKIRTQYAACERRFGKTQSAYNDCLGRLPAQRLPDHEIVSVIGRPTGDVELRVGVSAVALARL